MTALQVATLILACCALGFAVWALIIVRATSKRIQELRAARSAREVRENYAATRRYRPGGPVGGGDGSQ